MREEQGIDVRGASEASIESEGRSGDGSRRWASGGRAAVRRAEAATG